MITLATLVEETTADGIDVRIKKEQTMDQVWFWVYAAEAENYENSESTAVYDEATARHALKRITANVRRRRTLADKAAFEHADRKIGGEFF